MVDNEGHGIGNILDRGAEMVSSTLGLASAATLGATSGAAYVANAEFSDTYAIAACELAASRSPSPAVRELAEHLRRDHTSNRAALRREAERHGDTTPFSLDQRHKGLIDILAKTRTEDFDKAFLHQMTAGHTEALTLHSGYARTGDDAQLRQLAVTVTPVIQSHLELIKDLVARETSGAAAS